MRMDRDPGILGFQNSRPADWDVQRYAARILRQREAAAEDAVRIREVHRGSTSEEHRPDIDF